jgi:NAD(P)H-dependent FMN reductase
VRETGEAGGGEALSDSVRVLLISGSTRNGSANTAALVTAAALAPRRVTPDGMVSDPRFTATVADIWGAVLSHLDAAS